MDRDALVYKGEAYSLSRCFDSVREGSHAAQPPMGISLRLLMLNVHGWSCRHGLAGACANVILSFFECESHRMPLLLSMILYNCS